MSPLRVIIAVVGLLVLLFLGPIAYYTGKHVGLHLVCMRGQVENTDKDCWENSGGAILQGVRGPQPS
jgi:hypothetical protein